MARRVLTSFLLGLVFWSFSYAQHSGRIENVTVYPDRAQITRKVTVIIEPGEHTLEIPDLPVRLDQATLRVSAQGPGGLQLGSVQTRRVHGSDLVDKRSQEIEKELSELRDKKREVEVGKGAFMLQLKLLESLAEKPGEGELQPAQWGRAVEVLGDGAQKIYSSILVKERQIRDLDEKINLLQRELASTGNRQRDFLFAGISYSATQRGKAEFQIQYVVPQVSWAPRYDFRLDTEKAELELIQYAQIRQNTGEDWENVVLRVSSSRPSLGGKLPDLNPWYVDVKRPFIAAQRSRMMMFSDNAEVLGEVAGARGYEAAEEVAYLRAQPAAQQTAFLEAGDFVADYRVPGNVSLAGDNSSNSFRLTSSVMETGISIRAVPRIEPLAYLYTTTVYNGEAPVLPGEVTLYQDGVMVGRAGVGRIVSGETFSLAFGVDERVEILHVKVKDKSGLEGLIRRHKHSERDYLITVSNRHRRPVEITIIDRMPVSRDERIRVSIIDESDAPTVENLNNKSGVVAFTDHYEPNGEKQIRFGYRITYPDNLEGISGW